MSQASLGEGGNRTDAWGLGKGFRASAIHDGAGDGNREKSPASHSATYTYDGLGRLTQVSNNPQVNASYVYNAIGNMTSKDGKTITYSTAKPHTPTAFGTVALGHDDNGNRDVKGGASMHYDPEDHLTDYNGQVTFVYDYSGRKILEQGPSGVRYYFGDLAEYRSVNGYPVLTKHYFIGDTRIASRETFWAPPPPPMASAAPGVLLAGNPSSLGVALLIPRGLARGMGFAAAVLVLGLVVAPERRRRRVGGLLVHRGRIAVVAIVFLIAGAPLPVHVVILGATPAFAEGGGGPINLPSTPTWTPGPSPTPTRTATPVPPTLQVLHYHTDHLGSTQVITDGDGNLVQHIRYKAYGEIRGHWSAGLVSQTSRKRYEFTGYESEEDIGIDYARARFYDPDLGMFLTHDPARQFGNPYSYGGGNPANGTDPTGAAFDPTALIVSAVVIAVLAATAAGIDAAVRSGSAMEGMKAVGLSIGMSGIPAGHSFGLQLVAPKIAGQADAKQYSISLIPVVGSAYGAAQSFRTGNYASGVVGVIGAVLSAYSLYETANGFAQGGSSVASEGELGATPDSIQPGYGECSNVAATDGPMLVPKGAEPPPDWYTRLGLWVPDGEGRVYVDYSWVGTDVNPPEIFHQAGTPVTITYRNAANYKQFGHWRLQSPTWRTIASSLGTKTVRVPGIMMPANGVTWLRTVPFFDPASRYSPYPTSLTVGLPESTI